MRKFIILKPLKSRKDYVHFGADPASLPSDLLFLTPVLNQDQEDCTAFASVAIRQSMTGKAYDPERQWQAELQFDGLTSAPDGVDFKTPLALGVTTGFYPQGQSLPTDKASAYYFIYPNNGLDLFDSIRAAMQEINAPLFLAVDWLMLWEGGLRGIVPTGTGQILGGHVTKIAGVKTVDGTPYLVIQNSWGTDAPGSDQGLYYFSRDIVNRNFGKYAVAYWSDDPNVAVKRLGFLQALLQNVIALYQTLLVRFTAYPPHQTRPYTKIQLWAQAIAAAEGGNPALNNPGNLGYTTLTASWGARKGPPKADGGWLSQFDTYLQGFDALCNFLKLGCEDELVAFHQARTLEAFMNVYANHPPVGYLEKIATQLKVAPSIDISNFL